MVRKGLGLLQGRGLARAGRLALMLFCAGIASARDFRQIEADFVRGDIRQKTKAVKEAAASDNVSLSLKAIDFALDVQDVLAGDSDLNELLSVSVMSLKKKAVTEEQSKEISAKLAQVFKIFPDNKIRVAVLDKFEEFPAENNVSLINAYVAEKAQKAAEDALSAPMDDVLLKSIRLLRSTGNKTSFGVLFVADLMGIWPDYKQELEEAFGPLANSCGAEILKILASVQMSEKIDILDIVRRNEKISKKIKGEVAEKALSSSIYKADGEIPDAEELSPEQVQVQLASLKLISDLQWTRASKMVTDYFPIARLEYENNLITPVQFAQAIGDIAAVACAETGQVLSSYLDFLNKSMESDNAPVEAVVLSVIHALGGLGDKTAFDYLLYVTYLDYPQEVTDAARTALAQLKW